MRLRQLDVVRGLAILLVLIWHYLEPVRDTSPFLSVPITLFWSGVDLFFVLSGFLIGGTLLNNATTKNYYQVFYIRRSARILPLYWLVCISFLFFKYVPINGLDEKQLNSLSLKYFFTFTQNFIMAQYKAFSGPWLDVTWSLAVEEQFYIFLSLLIRMFSKSIILVVTVGLILVAPIIRSFLPSMPAFVLPLPRADSLMLGVLLALIWQTKDGQAFFYKYAFVFRWSFVFLFCIIGVLSYQGPFIGDAYTHFWLALFYLNLIILSLISSSKLAELFLGNKLLEWFGLRSYGIYLLHKPVQVLVDLWLVDFTTPIIHQWLIILVSTLITLGISELSYRFIEMPFIRLGHKFEYKQALPASS